MSVTCRIEFSSLGRRQSLVLSTTSFIIGRAPHAQAKFDCEFISREHLKVEYAQDGSIWITDLGSSNGTFVNEKKLNARSQIRLFPADTLRLGPEEEGAHVSIRFERDTVRAPVLEPKEKTKPNLEPLKHEISQLEKEKTRLNDFLHTLQEKLTNAERRNTEYQTEETRLSKKIMDLEMEIDRLSAEKTKFDDLQNRIQENEEKEQKLKEEVGALQKQVDRFENERSTLLQQITTVRGDLERAEQEAAQKYATLKSSLQIAETESEAAKKKFTLEAEILSAETKLQKAQTQREIEEATTRKISVEREMRDLFQKETELKTAVSELTSKCEALHSEHARLTTQIVSLQSEIENVSQKKAKIESELSQSSARLNEAQQEAKKIIETGQSAWEQEYRSLKTKASQEMQALRQKDLEEYGLWKSDEEKKARERLTKDIQGISHSLANRVLTHLPDRESIHKQTLLDLLEMKITEAIRSEAKDFGTFNPEKRKQTRLFWMRSTGMVAAAVLVTLGFVYGPDIVREHVAASNTDRLLASSQEFAEKVKQSQAQMQMRLENRPDFQPNYVDNVLYNSGYVEMKQDKILQKEWTIKLYDFFLANLGKENDRLVVDFVPIEAQLIGELEEQKKILKERNFDILVAKMRAIEAKHLETIDKILKGHENWEKLRGIEKEFYEKHL